MTDRTKRVFVIGGGITGLTAAYTLLSTSDRKNLEVTILEREPRLGGKIKSTKVNGNIVERGPESFLADRAAILRLCDKLGLSERIVGMGPEANQTYLAQDNHLFPLPPGTLMGIPFLEQTLISAPLPEAKEAAKSFFALPKSTFLTFRQGLQTLIDALALAIGEEHIRLGVRVVRINKNAENPSVDSNSSAYTIHLTNGTTLEADGVILTVPPFVAAQLLPDEEVKHALNCILYSSVATVTLLFLPDQVDTTNLKGAGFIVPKTEPHAITACTFQSSKWPHSTKDGAIALRCFLGGVGQEEMALCSDFEMTHRVREDLRTLMQINATPGRVLIKRWPNAIPQYTADHHERVVAIRQLLTERFPGILLAGAGYEGIEIPECIVQGEAVAQQLIDFIQQTTLVNHAS
ncbi:protoporphyrinogen oxidase [Sulfoacidibacillus thermotolerans]|uniref:Coproporphyrinogen III oxidase n=1 Tax=Sulfoacidibacillus thermotolerans TaxID=1765684 RepID=A0A2U3D6I2_SULT2|nr:protoporphyrinogen oxidase [Sulfoacidibacillus thermotolerans]PWI56892.1 protoporphyrinogen oxidase [Sulfoacidibacillus thermotolerans]